MDDKMKILIILCKMDRMAERVSRTGSAAHLEVHIKNNAELIKEIKNYAEYWEIKL